MLTRGLSVPLQQALSDTPVVFVHGPRQAGKSTLVKTLQSGSATSRYVTLDDAIALGAATADPAAFLSTAGEPTSALIIDEVQRAPDLFLPIKAMVDRDRRPGRFVLTGSANVLLLPRVSESLAGRIEILNLWPLSQGEIDGHAERFIDDIFAPEFHLNSPPAAQREQLIARVVRGGFPEVVSRTADERRAAWFNAYLTTVLQRDVRDLANIEGLTQFPRLLALLATRCATLLNNSELSRSSGIANQTLRRYMTLLQTAFLIDLLPAWSSNMSKRLIRTPKLLLTDAGLACHLLGADAARLWNDPVLLGPVLENFVAMELRKQLGWNQTRASLYHFRTTTGQEVDLLLESASGDCVGIEVKASSTVDSSDFRGLRVLAEQIGRRFRRGIVLHLGSESASFAANLLALPLQRLWSSSPSPAGANPGGPRSP